MKGTCAEGTIKQLFEGTIRSFIRCKNIEFESKREESYYDIQLDVKGCRTIMDSFAKYVETEDLDGDNQYEAEGHGKQDAEKGVKFLRFPPVLNIQLKRFEFDMTTLNMVKINDKFEFTQTLDLDRFVADDSPDHNSSSGVANTYCLHSVLVHSGNVHGGHYFVYVRPGDEPITPGNIPKVREGGASSASGASDACSLMLTHAHSCSHVPTHAHTCSHVPTHAHAAQEEEVVLQVR